MWSMLSAVQAESGGPALAGVLSGIPHDAASIAVYVLVVASIFVIWRAGRAKKPRA